MPNRTLLAGACALACLILPTTADAVGRWPLRLHSSGAKVRQLQADLTDLGIRTSADGVFGRATRRSVRTYERRRDITVDGRVSRKQARGIAARASTAATAPASGSPPAETDGDTAKIGPDGRTALAPADAPQAVKDAIGAANRIVGRPYRYGGGHGDFEDSGYDCSGTVSYMLHGARHLRRPRASGGLMSYAKPGAGEWITVYANRGHVYAVVAGLRLDTSGPGPSGPRWRPSARSGKGYVVRHPTGL